MSGFNQNEYQNEIGQRVGVPAEHPQGEHGTGHGLAGGHSHATASNTQAGGHSSSHPIADKFTGHTNNESAQSGNYAAFGTGRVPLASGITGALDQEHAAGAASGIPLGNAVPIGSHEHGSHHHHQSGTSGLHSASSDASATRSGLGSSDQAVSGAYAGGQTTNALTGESHARTTGAGVGPLAENLHGSGTTTGTGSSDHRGLAAAGVGAGALGAGAGAGAASYGTGVGPAGGAGGHYASGTGNDHGPSTGSAVGAGALGGAGAGSAIGSHSDKSSKNTEGAAGGPVVDPKELDTGGKHSLVFDEKTGKYEHRHDLKH